MPECEFHAFTPGTDGSGRGLRAVFVDLQQGELESILEGRRRDDALSDLKNQPDAAEWALQRSELSSEVEQMAEVRRIAGAVAGGSVPAARRSVDDYARPRSWGWLADGVMERERAGMEVSTDWRKAFFDQNYVEERGQRSGADSGSAVGSDLRKASLASGSEKRESPIRRSVNWRSTGSPWRTLGAEKEE